MTINLKENNDLIIKIEKSTQVLNQENYQVVGYDFRLYTNQPINHEYVEFISYNGVDFEDENIQKVETIKPYPIDEGIKDINVYACNVGLYNYGTLVVKYKGEVIDVFNNNQILNDDYEKRLLEQRIEQLENK